MHLLFAAEEAAGGSPLAALGVNGQDFIFHLITFVLVLVILRRFAFKPITKVLAERRKTIEDGIRLGQKLEKEKAKLDEEVAQALRDARHEADKIIADSHKEARSVIHEAEKAAARKSSSLLADAEVRISEETAQARKRLEKDIAQLVAETASAVVEAKIDPKADADLIDRALKARRA